MSAPERQRYSLRRPCAQCPFRNDIQPYLREDRAREIAASLRAGAEFTCHKTTVAVERSNEDGDAVEDMEPGPKAKFCAGAMATMEREGFANQLMRISENLGLYDATAMRSERQPVYDSLTDWVRAHAAAVPSVIDPWSGEAIEFQHCGVVAGDCEDPAGYGGQGVYENDEEPTCNPLEDECTGCGHCACPPCRSEQWDDDERLCVVCNDDEEEGRHA